MRSFPKVTIPHMERPPKPIIHQLSGQVTRAGSQSESIITVTWPLTANDFRIQALLRWCVISIPLCVFILVVPSAHERKIKSHAWALNSNLASVFWALILLFFQSSACPDMIDIAKSAVCSFLTCNDRYDWSVYTVCVSHRHWWGRLYLHKDYGLAVHGNARWLCTARIKQSPENGSHLSCGQNWTHV